jgi:hypothetical protein
MIQLHIKRLQINRLIFLAIILLIILPNVSDVLVKVLEIRIHGIFYHNLDLVKICRGDPTDHFRSGGRSNVFRAGVEQ